MICFEGVSMVRHTHMGEHRVLDDISFTIRAGQAIGIMGRNGAGKSTLLRVLTGVEHPSAGRIVRRMSTSWPLGFGAGFQGSLTGADNVRFIARIYGAPVKETLDYVEDFAELGDYFRMPLKTYSSGMRARLAFGASLAIKFDCLVIDEITAVGDHRFTERCTAAILQRKQESAALIMVSHSAGTLKQYCDYGAVLHEGRLRWHRNIDAVAADYVTL
jgi:capsular polysaccharide transport system ATP-binding protein